MLNISKLIHKPSFIKHFRLGNKVAQTRHYPPANKEWFNSIYAYNKNTIKLLPVADKVTLKVLQSYFNLYSPSLNSKTKLPRIRKRLLRLSTNRILISRPEFKHTSKKVVISVYVCNIQKLYYLRKLEMRLHRVPYLDKKIINYTKKKCLKAVSKVYKQKKKLIKTLPKKNHIIKNYELKYLKSFFSKCLKKEITLLYYKQIISFNKFKFEKTYLLPLTAYIKNIYKKEIEFNLVNLKHLYLNSYIFSQALVTKITNRKNRVLRVLRACLRMFPLATIDNLTIFNDMYNRKKKLQNSKVNYLRFGNEIKAHDLNVIKKEVSISKEKNDIIDKKNFFITAMQSNQVETRNTTDSVLDSIKNKSITGIRIEASGRLTRRNVAAKSIHKLRYKGSLKNLDSSYKGLSCVLFRGHAKYNVQYTKLKSKLRIGSFGLKGWVSSN